MHICKNRILSYSLFSLLGKMNLFSVFLINLLLILSGKLSCCQLWERMSSVPSYERQTSAELDAVNYGVGGLHNLTHRAGI